MNILVVSHEFPPIGGGGATACRYLSGEFSRIGHSVTVVTSSYKDCKNEEMIDGAHIYRVRALRKRKDTSAFHEMLSFVLSAYMHVDRLCKTGKFDVCLVFFGIPSGPIAMKMKRKYGISLNCILV